MVYMSGDNSLGKDGFLDADLEEMEYVGSTSEVAIIVLYDNYGAGNTHLYFVEKGKAKELEAPWLTSEMNLADGNVLQAFVEWTMENYPASHYLLDIWGHGEGWVSTVMDSGDKMSIITISQSLSAIPKLDILGFDSCNMAMVEVFYELQDVAEYIIASEKEEDANGWPYDVILDEMSVNPTMSPYALSQLIVASFVEWCEAYSSYSATLSAIETSKISAVATALDVLANALYNVRGFSKSRIIQARDSTERYDKTPYPLDLYNLCEQVADFVPLHSVHTASEKLKQSIAGAVVAERHYTCTSSTPIESVDNAHGVSIYMPNGAFSSSYKNLKLSEDTYWDEFLQAYPSAPEVEEPMNITSQLIDTTRDGTADMMSIALNFSGADLSLNMQVFNATECIEERTFTTSATYNFYAPFGDYYNFYAYLQDATGMIYNYSQLVGIWLGGDKSDAVVYELRILDEKGSLVNGAVLEGSILHLSALVGVIGDCAPANVTFYVDSEEVCTKEGFLGLSAFNTSWVAVAGYHNISVGVKIPKERVITNNVILMPIYVHSKEPKGPYYIGVSAEGAKNLDVVILNERTSAVIKEKHTTPTFVVEVPAWWYLEGDVISVEIIGDGEKYTTTLVLSFEDKSVWLTPKFQKSEEHNAFNTAGLIYLIVECALLLLLVFSWALQRRNLYASRSPPEVIKYRP